MKSIAGRLLQLGVAALCFATTPTSTYAQTYHTLTLPELNVDIGTWTDGSTYEPLFPGNHVWNDVPFTLNEDSLGNKVWSGRSNGSLDIPAQVFGATTAYTIINTEFGSFGANNGSIEFFGSEGAYHKEDLIQGTNVRDHFWGEYNNIINNTDALPAFEIGPVRARLDMQLFSLPASFADETLTTIRFAPLNRGIDGIPAIAAATVAVIPEPETYALMLAGLCVVGFAARRRVSFGEVGRCSYRANRLG